MEQGGGQVVIRDNASRDISDLGRRRDVNARIGFDHDRIRRLAATPANRDGQLPSFSGERTLISTLAPTSRTVYGWVRESLAGRAAPKDHTAVDNLPPSRANLLRDLLNESDGP
jgi:hypothetical protein